MANPKRCYVLGAGFSAAFGLPLAHELTSLLFTDAYPASDDIKASTRKKYLDYMRYFFPKSELRDDKPRTWPDFEELLTIVEEYMAFREAYSGSADTGGTGLGPRHFREVLLRQMSVTLCDLGRELSSQYKQTVQRFLKHVHDGAHAIVSFNWDLLLEIAAQELGMAISSSDSNSHGLQLAKPHGSIDHAEMPEKEYRARKAEVVNLRGLVETPFPGERIVLRAENPLDAANRTVHPFWIGELLVVPPNLRKTYTSSWIKSEWRRAMNMILEADEIFVIGYSLPAADLRPRLLFSAGSIANNKSRPITIVAPNALELAEHYGNYVACDVRPIEGSWTDWFDSEKQRAD